MDFCFEYYFYVTVMLQLYFNFIIDYYSYIFYFLILYIFPFAPIPLTPFFPSLNSFYISSMVIYLYLSVTAIFSATINGSIKSINILPGEDAKLAPAQINASK